jgi:Spy/CpxP family protein refolding chaperone
MRTRSIVMLLTSALAATACQSKTAAGTGRTERERDSVIGQSKIPGAGGVQKALDVADSSRNRVAREDSIATSP